MFVLNLPDNQNREKHWARLYGGSLAFATAMAAKQYHQGPVALIVDDVAQAEAITTEIAFYSGQPVSHLPDWETLPYDIFSPHQDIISERLKTLHKLQSIAAGQILILPISALLQKLAPAEYVRGNVMLFKTAQKLDIQQFRSDLEACGYSNVSQVMEHGEFSIRGSIIDLYPTGSAIPYRIDLFDDEIESIRSFDPSNQRSDQKIDSIEILPAREFPTDDNAIQAFRARYREFIEGDPLQSIIYKNVSEKLIPAGIEYYLPLFFEKLETLFDYLPANTLFIHPENLLDHVDSFWDELNERYEQRRHDIERPILAPDHLYQSSSNLFDALESFKQVSTSKHSSQNEADNLAAERPPDLQLQTQSEHPSAQLENFLQGYPGKVLFVAETPGRREVLSALLKDQHIFPKYCTTWNEFLDTSDRICITVSEIEHGLSLNAPNISVITESQIYGRRAIQTRRRKKRGADSDAIIKNLTDLNIGSPVVHLDHGVGRYLGLQKLEGVDYDMEFLTLEYAGGDKLYVPVTSLHLISRYTGASQDNAPLHKLGTDQWQKARRKAAKKAHDVAAELLDIYARRAATPGHQYDINQDEYLSFTNGFPFEETPDQETAINNVIQDLSTPRPMDRVVCGDVGFGKTEVAMRAAFVVANCGKQVAILVPTTLLAQQHYQNFIDRFADWPIKIECLSRFNTAKKQKAIMDELSAGKIDIIIGTHKLLQKSVKFKDLGLIIVDEEHRFGVSHKERLKSMRAEVDMLTLTATPIPRTLNMSLSGIRDLSIISTPPLQRHSINTFVTQWNETVVKEACQRELKRGGQIYFLHNEVRTIESKTREIRELLPQAKVEFAHGQMPERQLEQVMLDFYHQRFNVLVATTIIESGIDVPTANTIIINRADKLGLAQLHQIRGRVGRSHHKAYAYLITPPETLITADAKKRLEAIESLEDLGVGFTLATHDLEIRGAGELLGESQSGQISEIGFTLYTELLERAVESFKSGQVPDPDTPLSSGVEVDLGIPALIPDDYIHDIHLRLILYKRIASARNTAELDELRVEFIDRFGLLPDAVKNLFTVTEIKLLAERIGINKIEPSDKGLKIIFTETPNIDPAKLIELIQNKPGTYKFNGSSTLHIINELENGQNWSDIIAELINQLSFREAA